jgi:CBS domain-containing protein
VKPYLLKVADIMSTALITVRASELVTEAHAEMESGAVRHLPVVDDHGRLVGVLSDRDLLRAATAVERHAPRVSEIMSPDVVKVGPDTPALPAWCAVTTPTDPQGHRRSLAALLQRVRIPSR